MKIYLRDQLEDLDHLAENVNSEAAEKIPPINQLIQFWPFIRAALTLAKIFTGAKADKKINEIITWGDLLHLSGKVIG